MLLCIPELALREGELSQESFRYTEKIIVDSIVTNETIQAILTASGLSFPSIIAR